MSCSHVTHDHNISRTGTELNASTTHHSIGVAETSVQSFDDLAIVWQVVWRHEHNGQTFVHCTSCSATPVHVVLQSKQTICPTTEHYIIISLLRM